MKHLGHIHDLTSRYLFLVSGAALAAIVALYVFEVIRRYLFDAPTTWSGEVVQYALAVVIFGALPEVTRGSGHISIDILPDALSTGARHVLEAINDFLAAALTGTACLIVLQETLKLSGRSVMTNAAHPIPKWWITAILAIGLGSAALHFLRHGFGKLK
jgi:TRAP-type C4-dicarboxylate transport system permease small subunit